MNRRSPIPVPIKDQSSESFLHELEESYQRERMGKLWKEYGPYLIAGCVLAVIFTGALSVWKGWNRSQNEQSTATIIAALESEDPAAALNKSLSTLRAGPRGIALLAEAGLLLEQGKTAEALAALKTAAGTRGLDPAYRDLATLMSVQIAAAAPEGMKNAASLLAQLQPLRDTSSPWWPQAALESARLAGYGQGDWKQARAYLAPVLAAKEGVPPTLKARAAALDRVYSLKTPAE